MVNYGNIDDIRIGDVVEYDGNGKLVKGDWYIVKSFDKSNGRIKVVINDNGDTSTHTFNFMKLVKTKYNVGDTILHKPTKTTQVVKAIEMKLNVPCYRYEKGGFDNIKGMECRGAYELDVPHYRYTEDGFVNIKRMECREDHELDVPKTTAPYDWTITNNSRNFTVGMEIQRISPKAPGFPSNYVTKLLAIHKKDNSSRIKLVVIDADGTLRTHCTEAAWRPYKKDISVTVPTNAPDLSEYDFSGITYRVKQNPEEEKMKDNLEIDVKLNGKNVCAVKNEIAAKLRPKTELEIASYPFSAVCYNEVGDKTIVQYFKNEDKQKKFKKKYLQKVQNTGHTVILYNVSGAFTTKTPIVKITI